MDIELPLFADSASNLLMTWLPSRVLVSSWKVVCSFLSACIIVLIYCWLVDVNCILLCC